MSMRPVLCVDVQESRGSRLLAIGLIRSGRVSWERLRLRLGVLLCHYRCE